MGAGPDPRLAGVCGDHRSIVALMVSRRARRVAAELAWPPWCSLRNRAELGFTDTFRRTWDFYLANSEAGFAAGFLDVHQFLITR